MTDATTPPPEPAKVRLYALGVWPKEQGPTGADPTPLGARVIAWLEGRYRGPLTEREAAMVHEEFAAQETYRQRLLSAIQRCMGALQQQAQDAIKDNAPPFRISGGYESGRRMGTYSAYTDAAQQLANVINAVSVQTHTDNEKLTAERLARAAEEPKP